jgi:HlyD family secretion protein
LIAQTDASFGFDSSGQVTNVSVKVGDQVEKGQVLAQLDGTLEQMAYEEAEQNLLELYSAASIATVQQEIGTAQDAEYQAREWLKYLISPQVEEAEENLALAQQKLADAQAEAKANPAEAANQVVKEKEQAVAFLQDKLIQAQDYYENYYLPQKFGTWENVGSRRHPKMALATYIDPKTGQEVPEINGPSIDDIATARNNLSQALETIKEDEVYLQVLQTGVIPEGATGEKLTTLYNAQQAVEDAKAALKAKQLIAPIRGTVTSLNLNVGEQVEKASSSNTSATSATVTLFDVGAGQGQQTDTSTASIVTISQLDQPYTLDLYLDEADWSKAKVGNKVNVTFKLMPEQTFPGTVTLVYPVLNESFESSLVHILVQLDQRISQSLPAGT